MDSGAVSSTTPTGPAGYGAYDMGARRFGPDMGRFFQPDAFDGALSDVGLTLDPLTQNRYALAGGNPISYIETEGHMFAAYGGVGAAAEDPNPSRKNDKPSKVERFGKAFLGGLKNAGEETLNTFGDLEDCGSDHDEEACKRVRERGKRALNAYAQMEHCVYGGKQDACNDIENQVGCGDGFTAECAGNLTAIGVEAAATHRLGRTPGKEFPRLPQLRPRHPRHDGRWHHQEDQRCRGRRRGSHHRPGDRRNHHAQGHRATQQRRPRVRSTNLRRTEPAVPC